MNESIESKQKMTMTRFTEIMHNLSGAMMLIGQTLISAFFVIIILCLVLFVEIQRVAHGIQLFEQSPELAYFGAFVLVMMLLTLEFVIHYVESKSSYHQQRKTEFSLRLTLDWMRYFFGLSDSWKPRHKSPAESIKSYSRLLTITILALALGGSMSEALSSVQGNWMTGLQIILLESSLLEIVEWSGGLLFALALVVGAQRLTAYVAQRASETLLDTPETSCVDTTINIKTLENHQDLPDTQPVQAITIYDDSYLLQEPENHSYECPGCGESKDGYKSERYARQALTMHQRHCDAYHQAQNFVDEVTS